METYWVPDLPFLATFGIHVQYTQTESIPLRHFMIRLDSHVTSQLDLHGVPSHKSTFGMTNRQQGKRFVSIQQHFQPTLHSPSEVKIREIMIHEPSSFLKTWPQTSVDSYDSIEFTRQHFQPTLKVQINYIFQVSCKSTSGMSNQQKGK